MSEIIFLTILPMIPIIAFIIGYYIGKRSNTVVMKNIRTTGDVCPGSITKWISQEKDNQ